MIFEITPDAVELHRDLVVTDNDVLLADNLPICLGIRNFNTDRLHYGFEDLDPLLEGEREEEPSEELPILVGQVHAIGKTTAATRRGQDRARRIEFTLQISWLAGATPQWRCANSG